MNNQEKFKVMMTNLPCGTMKSDITDILHGWIEDLNILSVDLVPNNRNKTRKCIIAYVELDSKASCDTVVIFFKENFGDSFAFQNNFGNYGMVKVKYYIAGRPKKTSLLCPSELLEEEWVLSDNNDNTSNCGENLFSESNFCEPQSCLSQPSSFVNKIMFYELPLCTDQHDITILLRSWKPSLSINSIDIASPKNKRDRLNAYVSMEKKDCEFVVDYYKKLYPDGYAFINAAGKFKDIKVQHYTGKSNNKTKTLAEKIIKHKRLREDVMYDKLLAEMEDPWGELGESEGSPEDEGNKQYDELFAKIDNPFKEDMNDMKDSLNNEKLQSKSSENFENEYPFPHDSEKMVIDVDTSKEEFVSESQITKFNENDNSNHSLGFETESTLTKDMDTLKWTSSSTALDQTDAKEEFEEADNDSCETSSATSSFESDLDEVLKEINVVSICENDINELNGLLREKEICIKIKNKTKRFNKVLEDTLQEKCREFFISESDLANLHADFRAVEDQIQRMNDLKMNAIDELAVLKETYEEFIK